MAYRLGVDVGGTFTDLLLLDETSGRFWRHKTPSTPADSSVGILTGVAAICADAGVKPSGVEVFLHGTTVATNAILEGKGARVGLIVTDGYRQIMQIARSFVPGGLAGWIVWPKPKPLAALIDTIETTGRMSARGEELTPLDESQIRAAIAKLGESGVEALTVSLINAYAYANAAVRPVVGRYVRSLRAKLRDARDYGVVITNGALDSEATETLREKMRVERKDTGLFNRGGTIEELRETCLAETGLPAPRQPVWAR